MKFLKVVVSVIALVVSCCTFIPEEEYYKEVIQPDLTATTVSFFSMPDTAELRGYIDMFITSANQQEVVSHKVALNEIILSQQDGPPYRFMFDSRKYADGMYDLTLTLIKRVTSESLASKVGKEFTEVVLTKKIVIYNAAIEKPQITTTIENGVLIARWQHYPGRGFKQYRIRGSTIDDHIIITDRMQETMELPNFAGGAGYFSVQVEAFDEWVESRMQFDYPLDVTIQRTPVGIHYTWGESPFASHTKTEIIVHDGPTSSTVQIEAGEKSYEYPITWTFPHHLSTSINAVSEVGARSQIGYERFSTQLYLGRFSNVVTVSKGSADSLYNMAHGANVSGSYVNYVTIYNSKRDKTEKSISGMIGVSPNGLNIFEFQNPNLIKIDPYSLLPISSFDIGSMVGTFNSVVSVNASDGGIVLIAVLQNGEYWCYGIDWNTKQLLYSTKNYSNHRPQSNGKLTIDGRKIYMSDKLLRLDQTPNIVTVLDLAYDEFGIPQTEETGLFRLGSLAKRQVNPPYTGLSIPYTKAVVKVINSNEAHIAIVYNDAGVIKVDFISIETLEIVHTLETTLSAFSAASYQYYLVGNEFIVGSGSSSVYNHVLIEF